MVGSQPPMPLSTRMPNPGVWVMPRSTSVADEPDWNTCGTGGLGITLPRLAEVVNGTSVQVAVNVGGTLLRRRAGVGRRLAGSSPA